MSVSVRITMPPDGGSVVAGQPGRVSADVEVSGIFRWPRSVRFRVSDPAGNAVWSSEADITNGRAGEDCSWPNTPGRYTLRAECDGYVESGLAAHQVTFSVQPPAPASPPA